MQVPMSTGRRPIRSARPDSGSAPIEASREHGQTDAELGARQPGLPDEGPPRRPAEALGHVAQGGHRTELPEAGAHGDEGQAHDGRVGPAVGQADPSGSAISPVPSVTRPPQAVRPSSAGGGAVRPSGPERRVEHDEKDQGHAGGRDVYQGQGPRSRNNVHFPGGDRRNM